MLVSWFILFLAGFAGAQAQGDPCDLGLTIRGAGPLLVETVKEASGEWEGKKIDDQLEILCLDRLGADEKDERYYLKYFLTRNKEIRDCELTGITLERAKAGQAMTVADHRTVSKDGLERIALQASSLGLGLDLPEAVGIGEAFDVDFLPVAAFLLDTPGAVDVASGRFTLIRVDEKKAQAFCQGAVTIVEKTPEQGARYELEGDFSVDLKARLLMKLDLRGEATPVDPKETGSLKIKITATVKTGKEAEKAQREEPRFRDAVWNLEDKGIRLELPSFWYYETKGEEGLFSSTFNQEADWLRLTLKRTEARNMPMGEVMQFLENELRDKYDDAEAESVKSGLGSGRSVGYTNAKGEYVLEEFYALGKDHFLTVRFFGKGEGLKAGIKEYKKIRRKIKALHR